MHNTDDKVKTENDCSSYNKAHCKSEILCDKNKEKEKENKKCILYSTHYMEEAENICDKIVMINKGKVIAIGSPKEIKKNTHTTNLRDAFFELIGGKHE